MSLPAVIEDQLLDVQVVRDMDGLVAALKARRYELGLPQLEVDEIAGLQNGYCAKIESRMKNLGPVSLGCLLGALGLELHVVKTVPHHVKQGRI